MLIKIVSDLKQQLQCVQYLPDLMTRLITTIIDRKLDSSNNRLLQPKLKVLLHASECLICRLG